MTGARTTPPVSVVNADIGYGQHTFGVPAGFDPRLISAGAAPTSQLEVDVYNTPAIGMGVRRRASVSAHATSLVVSADTEAAIVTPCI